jgi:integrase/recombinase XerC
MSPTEVRKFFSALKKHKDSLAQRDYVMFSLMLGTGIRVGSLVGLNVEDVNLSAGTLTIRAKGGVEQTVYLNPALKKLLRRHLKELEDSSTALLCSRSGRRLQARQVQLRFGRWLKEAGVKKHTVRSLRHTFGTWLYRQTSDIYLVQKVLGHSSPTTTQRYAQVAESDLRDAMINV